MQYKNNKNKKCEAIIILGGGLIKNRDDIWQTRNYNDGSGGGERIRVLAGYYLYKRKEDGVIIASGGKGKKLHEPTTVTISSVIKKELMELGIPKQKIIEDNKSISTLEQLESIKKLINGYSKISIISNKYHLPRIKTMIAYIPELKFLKNKVRIISGENTVIKYGPAKWRRVISATYKTRAMKKRIAQEKQGIKDIKFDNYRPN